MLVMNAVQEHLYVPGNPSESTSTIYLASWVTIQDPSPPAVATPLLCGAWAACGSPRTTQ